jgi:hypothetical protein
LVGGNLNILSSQDTNNTKSNTKHKNLNVSYTLYGTNSSNQIGAFDFGVLGGVKVDVGSS